MGQPWQRPVTTWAYKPEAANTVYSSWWWAVCRSKHVELLKKYGVINSITSCILFVFLLSHIRCTDPWIMKWNNEFWYTVTSCWLFLYKIAVCLMRSTPCTWQTVGTQHKIILNVVGASDSRSRPTLKHNKSQSWRNWENYSRLHTGQKVHSQESNRVPPDSCDPEEVVGSLYIAGHFFGKPGYLS